MDGRRRGRYRARSSRAAARREVLIRKLLLASFLWVGVSAAGESPDWVDAVQHDRVRKIAMLLDVTNDVDSRTSNGKTALMAAARRGDNALALRLLAAGADVQAVNNGGGSPLHYAAWFGDPATVALLIDHGAVIDQQSNNGWTALMMTAAKNHSEAASTLLRRGAAPDLADIYDWTPLMRAAHAGHTPVLLVLLRDPGIDVDRLNDQGQSALHLAAIAGDSAAVQKIVEAGARVDIEDLGGRTPIGIAEATGRSDIVEILRLAASRAYSR